MRVVVTRTGGIAGLRREWSVDVETQPDADAWRRQLDALPWRDADESGGRPDGFVYVVRVEDGGAGRSVTLGEARTGSPWRALIDHVRTAG